MFLTANNERVQAYMLGNTPPSTNAKRKRLSLFKELLEKAGTFLSELFPNKQEQVMDEILYLTSGCGIAKIGADRLAERTNVSIRTVSTVVNKLKKTSQYIVARINSGRAGKYIFVDKLHPNFAEIMDVIFRIDATQFAYQVACLKPSQNTDTTSSNEENSSSNHNNQFTKTSSIYNNSLASHLDEEAVQEIQNQIDNEPVMDLDAQKEQLDQYATNEYQHLLFDTMRILPLHQEIENNLYKISLRVGSNATIREFHVAKDAVFELNVQLIESKTTIKQSTVALFESLYKEALSKPDKHSQSEQPAPSSNFIFYNWLEERENSSNPEPSSVQESPYFYNRLDERE